MRLKITFISVLGLQFCNLEKLAFFGLAAKKTRFHLETGFLEYIAHSRESRNLGFARRCQLKVC